MIALLDALELCHSSLKGENPLMKVIQRVASNWVHGQF